MRSRDVVFTEDQTIDDTVKAIVQILELVIVCVPKWKLSKLLDILRVSIIVLHLTVIPSSMTSKSKRRENLQNDKLAHDKTMKKDIMH